MKKVLVMFLALMLLPIMAFAAPNQSNDVNGYIDWKNGVVQVVGIGYTPNNATNISQATSMARRAAILDSYRNMLEAVKGVQVDSETTVSGMQMNDTISTKISGVVRGSRIVSEEVLPNGTYKVVAEVKLFGENSVAEAVLSTPKAVLPLPEPTNITPSNIVVPNNPVQSQPSNPVQIQPISSYTGVVVDAKGLGLERVMSPVIEDTNGRIVYGNQYIDSAQVVKYGMVDYATAEDMSEIKYGRSRAGASPMTIKAVAVKDFSRNIVISVEDADKMLSENKTGGFLGKTAVVFIQ